MTKQWDSSVVIPALTNYGIKAPGYNPSHPVASQREFRWECERAESVGGVACYYLGPGVGLPYAGSDGNPAENYGAQYGWHVQLVEEAADHTWAKVRIWNSYEAVDTWVRPDKTVVIPGDVITYDVKFRNGGSFFYSFNGCVPLDTTHYEYVLDSATPGTTFLGSCPTTLVEAQEVKAPDAIGALMVTDTYFDPEEEVNLTFKVRVKAGVTGADIQLLPKVYDDMVSFYTSVLSTVVNDWPLFLPWINR
jgi:hypothetical protein